MNLKNNEKKYVIVKGVYDKREKANLIELRFTAMLNSFVRFMPRSGL
jgi:hypothetical protein